MHSEITPKLSWSPEDHINYVDLNRIENNTAYYQEFMETYGYYVDLIYKEDWLSTDFPFHELTKRIIDNIKFLAALHLPMPVFDELPASFDKINSQGMANIENYLKILYDNLEENAKQFRYSGTFICGQDTSYL